MSITLSASPSLDELSQKIMKDLQEELDDYKIGVFDKQWIVTQTEGINFWMKNQIAENTGVAANLQFAKMNDIVQLIYHWVCPNTAHLMDKDRMTWALFAELDEQHFKDSYPNIAGYYVNSQMRRVSLAVEMADLFDQYQIYRHQEIENWNKDEVPHDADLTWQQHLWKKMKARLGDGYADRLEVSKQLLTELKKDNNKAIIQKKLPCLRFFGLAIVTPYFLEIFRVLSEIIDIHFYLLNPCPELIWMYDLSEKDIAKNRANKLLLQYSETGNELLLNWGSVMKDSYKLMLSDDFYINHYDPIGEHNDEVIETLLQRIRQDIRHNMPNEKRSDVSRKMLEDGSLRINGCFTPVREVEVLYNYLIDQFANNKTLHAREVVVMVNDMDKYAPYIRAVFDNAPIQIPYSIADESVTKGNTLFTAMQEILSIHADAYKSEEVLGLLDSAYIRRRFGFKDISAVRQAVREAGIANGMGSTGGGNNTYEATEAWMVSWEYGLQKIMYGLCMSSEEEFHGGTRPLYTLNTAEGAGMHDRIRLYEFFEVLREILKKRSEEKTLSEWSNYLGEIMNDLILEEDEEDDDVPRLAKLKEVISELEGVTGTVKIDFPTFRQVCFVKLEQEKRSNRYADKGINFCGMLPMRSVPYKIVAMLGLDFDTFPRQDSALSFSLIGKQKRLGDRSVRENDKHLFLESILAAKDKLYISYLARDVKKGGEQPPSTLVDELMDYIVLKTANPAESKKTLVCVHPLHVFSNKYTLPDNLLPANYVGNSLVQGRELETDPNKKIDLPDFTDIKLHDFATFIKHPIKYYFNKKLGVYYREEDERIRDTELFELDHLQKWQIKDSLIKEAADLEQFTEKMKRAGKLPLANMGKAMVNLMIEDVVSFRDSIKQLTEAQVKTELTVFYVFNEHKISGQITVYGDNYVYYAFTKSILKHIMYPWVCYLVAIAQESAPKINFAVVFNVKENDEVMPKNFFIPYSQEIRDYAIKTLPSLVEIFTAGNKEIFLFYPPLALLCYKHQPPAFQLEELVEEYNEIPDSKYASSYFHGEEYLTCLAEAPPNDYHLFHETTIGKMTENTRLLMDKLFELFPSIFQEEK